MSQTTVNPIPQGYHTVTPYLTVKDAGALIDFMKKAFDAQETYRMAAPDGKVRHAEVRIGDSKLMIGGSDANRPSMLYLYVADCDAWYRRAIAAGAKSLREPTTEFYGDRSSGVEDAFGIQWWIGTHVEDVSPEEIARRAALQK